MLGIFLSKNKKYKREYKLQIKNEKEIKKIEQKIDKFLREKRSNFRHPNYNPDDIFNNGLYKEHLINYLKEEIVYVYVRAKNTTSVSEKEIFANSLCKNLCSFIDLYSQILNVFYDLNLDPLRKNFSFSALKPATSLIDQAIDGDLKKSEREKGITSWNKVKSEISKSYNEDNIYYHQTKEILDEDKSIKAMKSLRNYSIHYQPLFSKFEVWYRENEIVGNVNSNTNNKEEYNKFIELSRRVIKQEVKIIYNFEGMCYDLKMMQKNETPKICYIFECPSCGAKLLIPELFVNFSQNKCKIKLFCEKCKEKTILKNTHEKVKVHPEKYNQLISYESKNIDIIDNNGKSLLKK